MICISLLLVGVTRFPPVPAKEMVAKSEACIYVEPTRNPYEVKVQTVLFARKSQPKGQISLVKRIKEIKVADFAGVTKPTILFVKQDSRFPGKWRLVNYYHDFIEFNDNCVNVEDGRAGMLIFNPSPAVGRRTYATSRQVADRILAIYKATTK